MTVNARAARKTMLGSCDSPGKPNGWRGRASAASAFGGFSALGFAAPFFPACFFAFAMVVRNGLRGVGDTKWILGITVFGCYGIRLPLAWFLGIHLEYGLVGIWWGLMLELAVRGTMFLARFKWGNWESIRV